jgi:iron complex outermembrane recepter protein
VNPFANTNAFLGEDDDNWVSSNTIGGTAQLTNTNKVFEHENHVVVGASLDHGSTAFRADSELGTIDPGTLYVQGFGVFLNQPTADASPVNLHAINTYTGFYATDTFDVTNRLSVTAGARFNIAQINLQDETGESPQLTGDNYYQHLNPMVGATYKITPNVTAYADYAVANRAPTPLELECSSPTQPCQVDTFLVADPPLKQVVSYTIEGGLRGGFGTDAKTGQLTWGLGAFDTVSDDDIIQLAAPINGPVANFGFFQNFGKTERKGVEAKVDYTNKQWKLYANYTYLDATYQAYGQLDSPNNPNAITINGVQLVNVVPGDHIGGIPANRFKVGAEYAATDKWKVGADLNVVGSSYLVHDDTNQSPQVPAYAVLNLHTSYQVTPNVEVFGLINNALDQHYYLFGTFTSMSGFTAANLNNTNTLGVLTDPRAFVPGAPFEAYAGVKMRF